MPNQVGTSQVIRFATFEVDLQAQELRKSGLRVKLTGQPFQVLAILLEHPGQVVTREELQKRLWPDTFVDVDHNLNTSINKIREALGDSSESPRFVETLPRRGYRFIAPLPHNESATVPPATEKQPLPASVLTEKKKVLSTRLTMSLGAVALFAALGIVLFRTGTVRNARQPAIKSLAVLPLRNLSGDPTQEYLADGMTEALIGRLSGIHDLRVISRTSVMHFKDTQLPVTEIAKTLQVDRRRFDIARRKPDSS
jgi:DNA-binding winged helix-turn-helix (wHTH) protein